MGDEGAGPRAYLRAAPDLIRARFGVPVLRAAERVRWGGERRRVVLEALLLGHYRSRFRREWQLIAPDDVPHFFDHRIDAVEAAVGRGSVMTWQRAFHVLEVLNDGDRLLDIGCGDGFFDRHFFVERCEQVVAVDIEPTAIEHARAHQGHERIEYRLLDATAEPLPGAPFDVIVFDGALGHFPPQTTDVVLAKIAAALSPGGVFVGSESLGDEGTDHLQYFQDLRDLGEVLRRHFPRVALRESSYTTSTGGARREAYWRCARDGDRIDATAWTDASAA